jgi:hypothetical protein
LRPRSRLYPPRKSPFAGGGFETRLVIIWFGCGEQLGNCDRPLAARDATACRA